MNKNQLYKTRQFIMVVCDFQEEGEETRYNEWKRFMGDAEKEQFYKHKEVLFPILMEFDLMDYTINIKMSDLLLAIDKRITTK